MKNWMLIALGVFGVWYFFMRKKTVANNPVASNTPSTKEAQVTALLAQDSSVS